MPHRYLVSLPTDLPPLDFRKLGIQPIWCLPVGAREQLLAGTLTLPAARSALSLIPAWGRDAPEPAVAVWADSTNGLVQTHNWSTWVPWERDDLWANLCGSAEALAQAAEAAGLTGLFFDAEIYRCTAGGSGGRMLPGAWPLARALPLGRGRQFAEAVLRGGLTGMGTYVWVQNALRFPAWTAFSRGAASALPRSSPFLCLDEGGYVSRGYVLQKWVNKLRLALSGVRARLIPGLTLDRPLALRIRERGLPGEYFLWDWHRGGDVWR